MLTGNEYWNKDEDLLLGKEGTYKVERAKIRLPSPMEAYRRHAKQVTRDARCLFQLELLPRTLSQNRQLKHGCHCVALGARGIQQILVVICHEIVHAGDVESYPGSKALIQCFGFLKISGLSGFLGMVMVGCDLFLM